MALKSRAVAALLGAGLALTVGVPGASADDYHPSALPNTVVIGSAASPHCLEIADWGTADGASARQWSCTGGANQSWRFSGGSLVNVNSGKCLEIADWGTANGASARQWSCTGGANQKWLWTHIPGTGYTLRNVNSGKCLDTPGNTNGVRIQQWDCWNGDNQIWYGFAVGSGPAPVDY
ncbi:RICIN domain-containing protein [Kitasatospora cineracea]|uniref:RICIN domain-containing protein n=1 Tax=Kitasatospora cineracea TaxID=88074 RepID=UPI0013C2D2F9|nr:RICIN domain-containing protein [Kitasatospora cineracea]